MRRHDVKQCLSPIVDSGKGLRMNEGQSPASREERLAAKLRENLRRRKAQSRALDSRESADADGDDGLPKAPERG